MRDVYDVVIVGAGPGGSAAGHYLALQGFKVLLLDKFSFPRDKTCGDALTPRALRVLDDMGILDDVLQLGHRLDKVEFIAPKGHTALAPIPRNGNRSDSLLFVPRLVLDNVILERARATGAEFQSPVRVIDVARDDGVMLVKGEYQGKAVTFKARMVIVAIGANVKLLVRMGLLKKPPMMVLCSRTYYEGMSSLPDSAQCRFDGVPLPGYGWVFPLSETSANVGVGLFKVGIAGRWMPNTAREAFDTFIHTPALQKMLRGARQVGPIKGYPVRVDLARSPTFGEGVLLVGEAAGLVNPVTGEGIDYALESGKIAAEHIARMLHATDLSRKNFVAYDKQLRQQYQRLFVVCDGLRLVYLNPLILNRAVTSAARNSELMTLYMNIAIENQDIYKGLSPATITKAVFR